MQVLSGPKAALAVALGLVLVWGTNFALIKALLAQVPPGGLLFVRYLVTPACAVLLLLGRFGWRWPRMSAADWWQLAGLALLGHVLHVGMMLYGIQMSTAFSGALISTFGPLFTLLIVWVLGLHRFGRMQIVGVALAVGGVLLFLSDKLAGPLAHGTGDLVLLLATALFSIHTVAARGLIARHGAMVVTAYASLLASVVILATYWRVAATVPWSTLRLSTWTLGAWSFIVASFGGWLVWGWVNGVRGVARSAPLLYLLPPVAGFTAWLVLGEAFTATKLLGAALALAGVAAAQFGGRDAGVPS